MSLIHRRKAKGIREFTLPLWTLFLGLFLAVPTLIAVMFGILWGVAWAIDVIYRVTSAHLSAFGWTSAGLIIASILVSYITTQEAEPSEKQRKVILMACFVALILGIVIGALTGYVAHQESN